MCTSPDSLHTPINSTANSYFVLSDGIPQLGTPFHQGKVREVYDIGNKELLFLSTDRISAFDKNFTSIPEKGQILTKTSTYWFELLNTVHKDIPHHFIANPDPNCLIVKKLQILPIEFVMRGYLTGSTSTSIWKLYQKGTRRFGGIELPDDLCKNSTLPEPLLTPTTKSSLGDKNISKEEILQEGILTEKQWEICEKYCHRLFNWGKTVAKNRGLVLVDTKYEFGLDEEGTIFLVDEIHTPDSSRYWLGEDVPRAFLEDRDPKSFDKEWFRNWLRQKGDPYSEDFQVTIPEEIIYKIRMDYIQVYETLLETLWEPTPPPTQERIIKNLELFQSSRRR